MVGARNARLPHGDFTVGSFELARLKEPHRGSYLKLIGNLEQVDLTEEAAILAEGYIARGIFHRKYIADALHVGDCIVSQDRLFGNVELRSSCRRAAASTHQALQHGRGILRADDRDAGVSGVRSNGESDKSYRTYKIYPCIVDQDSGSPARDSRRDVA